MKTWLKPYVQVVVDAGDYHYIGQAISYPTPEQTIMVRRVPDDPSTMEEMKISKLSAPGCKYNYVHYAVVGGRGSFPVDMLRYDYAAPVNFRLEEDEMGRITTILNEGETELIIARATQLKSAVWTTAR